MTMTDDFGRLHSFGGLHDVVAWCEPKFEEAPLEESIAELKEQNRKLLESCEGATMMYKDLCKAKELLKRCYENYIYMEPLRNEIKQFLKETKDDKRTENN